MIGRPSFAAPEAIMPVEATRTAEPMTIGSRISLRSRAPTRGDFGEPLAERGALSQHVVVVVEEEDPDYVDAVNVLLELRQDHLAELVAGRVAGGGEDVGDFHASGPYPEKAGRPEGEKARKE